MTSTLIDTHLPSTTPSLGEDRMTATATSSERLTANTRRKPRRRGGVEFGLLYMLAFTIFLVAAVVTRILRIITWRRSPDTPRRSIFREAREATGATIPYAFMG
jgi:hypothetical protein